MKCIIIEDQPPAQRILKKYIEDLGSLELIGTFAEATAVPEFLNEHNVDLIFLDIHLPKLSGIEFLKALPQQPHIVLTTAFPDYALEGYDLNVVDYLLKPFSFQRFVQAVNKANALNQGTGSNKENPNEIFIKTGYEHTKVALDELRYIKSDADYTEFHVGDKKLLSYEPLRFWEDYLDQNRFMRIHKSYIVNASRIEKVGSKEVVLDSGEKLPIGRAFKQEFNSRFFR